FLESASACTIPVFRYALDRWAGKPGVEGQEVLVFQEVANRILAGDSAVWIQIDSGNQEADDAAFDLLQSRLTFFQSVAELPEIDPNDPTSQLGPGPTLELKFSTMRVSRDEGFVRELAGPKFESLPEDEAWIAPVFGRGRVLGAWPASLMDEEGIDEACFYLTGACSCQVKKQNPGWDLPIQIDWQARLWELGFDEPETAPVSTSLTPTTEPATVVSYGEPPSKRPSPAIWIAAILLLTTGASIMVSGGSNKKA
ncbi:MAG: hypothetical protein AAGH89_09765, partial [Verrucomicrobiota bacterium]